MGLGPVAENQGLVWPKTLPGLIEFEDGGRVEIGGHIAISIVHDQQVIIAAVLVIIAVSSFQLR